MRTAGFALLTALPINEEFLLEVVDRYSAQAE
jgi:hypothetical protein